MPRHAEPIAERTTHSGRLGRRLALSAVLACVLGSVAAPAAQASKTQESIFQDEGLLQSPDPGVQAGTLNQMQELGVDTIHALVGWGKIAPRPASRTKPNFDATNPDAYPDSGWAALDLLVKGATERKMDLILSPVSKVPPWAQDCNNARLRKLGTCEPDAKEFQRFVTAVGKRYPQVKRWSIWNEPNFKGWLSPQWIIKDRQIIPYGPILYRKLFNAAVKGLGASGHGGDEIMFGETAPIGQLRGGETTNAMAPGLFLREAMCLNPRGRPYRGKAAQDRQCRGVRRIRTNAISHHPYTKGGSRPPTAPVGKEEITLGYISRLQRIMKQGQRAGRLAANLPIYSTEYGFQTNPPDKFFGLPSDEQALYINESDYIAYQNSQIAGVAQYELIDDPLQSGFQTGLRFSNGEAKPSLDAYRLPIYVVRTGGGVAVYGQVRPAPDDVPQQVQIQVGSGGSFQTVESVTTKERGFFLANVPSQSGRWRLVWTDPRNNQQFVSRLAEVRDEPKRGR